MVAELPAAIGDQKVSRTLICEVAVAMTRFTDEQFEQLMTALEATSQTVGWRRTTWLWRETMLGPLSHEVEAFNCSNRCMKKSTRSAGARGGRDPGIGGNCATFQAMAVIRSVEDC